MQTRKSGRVTILAAFAGCTILAAATRGYAEPPDNDANHRDRMNQNDQNSQKDRNSGQNTNNDNGAMPAQSAGEVKQVLDRSQVSLPDLIKAAETKTGGKACSANVMEWRCISDNVTNTSVNGDVSVEDLRKNDPSSPVALITCVNNNSVSEVVVCGKSGKVIAMRQCSQFQPGKSAFYCAKGNHQNYGERTAWNQAPRRWQRVTDLMKKPVHAMKSDEHVAEIKDLVLDPDSGRMMYSVIEFYGKMGHGNRWYAVPLCVAKLSEDYKTVDMDYTSSEVNAANGFDRASWPNITDEKWAKQVYKAYGERPYWKSNKHNRGNNDDQQASARAGSKVISVSDRSDNNPPDNDGDRDMNRASNNDDNPNSNRNRNADNSRRNGRYNNRDGQRAPERWQKATDLVGKTVRNPQTNEDLGTLNDIVIDPDTGRIIYGVLSFGGFLGLGDELFAIPWGSLELASDYKAINLSVDKERLKNAEGFDEQHWPNMADQRWAAKTHDYYGRPRYWEADIDVDVKTHNDSN